MNSINAIRISMLRSQLIDSDSINSTLSTIITNSKSIIDLQSGQRQTLDSQIVYWEKAYKKQKRQKFIVGGVSILLLVLVAL